MYKTYIEWVIFSKNGSRFYRAYKSDLMEINEKIDSARAELQQIENKVKENSKLAEDRRKHINELESNLRILKLEVEEIQSIEYPQEADVEVMVND